MQSVRFILFTSATIGLLLLLRFSALYAGVILPLPPNGQVTDAGLVKLADATQPALAVLGNTLYATWLDEREGYDQPDVYFAQSTDGGVTWSANTRVSERPYDDWSNDPVIAVQPNGVIWVAWYLFYTTDSEKVNDVRLARSTDGGQTWERFTVVNGVPDNEDLWRPAIAADESNVYLLYRLWGEVGGVQGYDIKLKVIDAQSVTITTTAVSDVPVAGRITGGLLDDGPATTLIQRNGLLCAAWEDRRSTFAIYSACSTDRGASFSANVPVSGANAVYPVLALAPDGTLYGSYTASGDARRNISLRASTNNGVTWGEATVVTNVASPFKVGDWALTVDANGQLLLGWINDGSSAGDVILSTSVDRGQNFSSVQMEDGQGQFPTVSDPARLKLVTSGADLNTKAHLIWQDDRNVHDEIWSATALLDGVAPNAPAALQAQADDHSIVLTWQPATDAGGISGYRVYRATTAAGPFSEITFLLQGSTSYRDVELPPGATFFYQVAAVDKTGNTGPVSASASATAQGGSGLAVTGLIAYQSGADSKVRNLADNAERTIANVRGPQWSLDGQRLYVTNNGAILWQPPNGGQLTTFAGPFDGGIEFDVASDNSAFAVIGIRQFAAPGAPGFLCTVTEPRYFERAGQEKYVGTNALALDITVAANGRWIAYRYTGFCNVAAYGLVTPANLCLVKTTTGEERCVEGLDATDPDFAPAGSSIVFAAPISGQAEIWKAVVQEDGTLTNYTQLTRGPADQPSRDPAFSSDGNWVVFARDTDPGVGEAFRLFVVRNDGQGLRPLELPGTDPTWLGGGSAPSLPDLPNKTYLPMVQRR